MATTDDSDDAGADDPEAPDAHENLLERYGRGSNLRQAGMFLNWDQQVTMPEGGAPGRAQQLSAVSTTAHELLTDDEVGEWPGLTRRRAR